MFRIDLRGTPVLFGKFFSGKDAADMLDAIRATGAGRCVFVDTPATEYLVGVLRTLKDEGYTVMVRDHHDAPTRRNDREVAIADAADAIRALLGDTALISTRELHQACSLLIESGEFSGENTVIVADQDADGLLGAMKAAGITYDELDADAAVLDGSRAEQTAEQLSPLGLLLVQGLATLPPFDSARPQVAESAKLALFEDFAMAVEGRGRLEARVAQYEAAIADAEFVAESATEVAPDVWHVDAVGRKPDLTTLAARLEARPGARVTVVRKDNGPIASKHGGVQVSLAVVKAFQAEINLQELLAPGFDSSPDAGLISNTTFLLHVSEERWLNLVLPALQAKFAPATV